MMLLKEWKASAKKINSLLVKKLKIKWMICWTTLNYKKKVTIAKAIKFWKTFKMKRS